MYVGQSEENVRNGEWKRPEPARGQRGCSVAPEARGSAQTAFPNTHPRQAARAYIQQSLTPSLALSEPLWQE